MLRTKEVPTPPPRSASEEWKAGWTVVLAAFFGVSIAAMPTHALGVLVKPMSEAFGWTRAQITVAPLLVSIGTLVFSPVAGALVDRLGARRVALVGVPLFAVMVASVGFHGGHLAVFYGLYAVLAMVLPAVGPMTWSLGVASRFHVSRGASLGIAMSGMAALGTFVPIITQLAYEKVGVNLVWAVLGAMAMITAYPTAVLFFRDANDLAARGRMRAGSEQATRRGSAEAPELGGLSFAEGLRSRRFWQLAASLMIGAAASGLFMIHFASMLTDRGIGAREAAMVLGAMAPATMTGRIAGGFLLDRFHAPWVAAVTLALPLFACVAMLAGATSLWLAVAVALSVGFAIGSEGDIVAYLSARYFGLRSYGKIYGMLFGLYGLGFGIGSAAAGALFGVTGSYQAAWLAFCVLLPIAIFLMLTLGAYPRLEDGQTDLAAR